VRECGEEAGEQNSDLMDKNRVRRRGVRGKLASDSDARKGSKQLHVNAARIEGKLSHLIRGGLSQRRQKSAEAIVVVGVTTHQGGW
jgi:hypothetical protein